MKNYSLSALLKIRERKKGHAELMLREAISLHLLEQKKLEDITWSLQRTINLRAKLQKAFFLKAQHSPSNKSEVTCHINSNQKTVSDEKILRSSLVDQTKTVKYTELKLEIAKKSAIDAQRNFKLIERHHASWQQQKKKAEEIKYENENDEQNTARFLLKRA